MRTILITGNHPRHHLVASAVARQATELFWIREARGPLVPDFVSGLSGDLGRVAKRHYEDRVDAETMLQPRTSLSPLIEAGFSEIDWSLISQLIDKESVDLVISFGCSKLPKNLLNKTNCRFVNLHGGLSPRYKGTMTTFWPSYMLEPEMTGYTIHETTENLDGGQIFHQVLATMLSGQGVNQVAASASLNLAKELPEALEAILSSNRGSQQRSSGKTWANRDWSPLHLLPIYLMYDNKTFDYCLQFRERLTVNPIRLGFKS